MDYDIKIDVSYIKSLEDVSITVQDEDSDIVGYLREVPTKWEKGSTVNIDGELYVVSRVIGDPDYRNSKKKSVRIELKKHGPQTDYFLSMEGVESRVEDRLKTLYSERVEVLEKEYHRLETDLGREIIGAELKHWLDKWKHITIVEQWKEKKQSQGGKDEQILSN